MLVKGRMTKEPPVVSPQTPIEEAICAMHEIRVRHCPAVRDRNTLVNHVTQTDLLQASPSPTPLLRVWEMNFLLAKMRVRQRMPIRRVDASRP